MSKVKAVTEVTRPEIIKERQRFLGFANFQRWFISNYSITAAPLTSLLIGKPKKVQETDSAQTAFETLKTKFTTATKHLDPNLPFIIEVDASDCGIGAVLSQRHGTPGRLYPCAFFSRKLTTAEWNYWHFSTAWYASTQFDSACILGAFHCGQYLVAGTVFSSHHGRDSERAEPILKVSHMLWEQRILLNEQFCILPE